jgi:hypothetical protein
MAFGAAGNQDGIIALHNELDWDNQLIIAVGTDAVKSCQVTHIIPPSGWVCVN